MNSVSKTGLIASPKKSIRKCHKPPDQLNLNGCAIARPAPFSLRPFGGLYNPYAKGCSILCNHPGPNEVKNVVRQAKDAWLQESKMHGTGAHDAHSHAPAAYKCHVTGASEADADCAGQPGSSHADDDLPEHVPEEFFRRYTGSDSRPMTPTPTVASGRTRTSAGSGAHGAVAPARRCFTPDPAGHSGAKARQQLILDLRRSHSQETLYWNASSELTPTATGKPVATAGAGGRTAAVAAAGGSASPGTGGKSARSLRLCELEAKRRADAELVAAQLRAEAEALLSPVPVCVNALDEYDDGEDEGPRRRGKRKKKCNKPQSTATYKVSEEPETQIATLGPDSPNQSNRPSLVPNGADAPPVALLGGGRAGGLAGAEAVLGAAAGGGRRSSFISEEAMKYLRRGLNVDVVEGAFERYMNRALLEALRTLPADQLGAPSDALRSYQAAHPIPPAQPLRWLSMPRKYARKSVRFTLPINTFDLGRLSPIQYVSQHVWLSECRKELCRCVFAKYQPVPAEADTVDGGAAGAEIPAAAPAAAAAAAAPGAQDPWVERTLDCAAHLDAALGDVLGFYATGERIAEIREMLGLIGTKDAGDKMPTTTMNFRSWCGVVAFGERYLNRLCREQDPCDEIEVADFQSLERKFNNVAVNEPIRRLLTWIKYH